MEETELWTYLGVLLGLNVATGVAAFSLGRLYRKNRIYREGFERGIEYLKYSIIKVYLDKHQHSNLKEKEHFRITVDDRLLDEAEKNAKRLEGFL